MNASYKGKAFKLLLQIMEFFRNNFKNDLAMKWKKGNLH